MRASFSEPRIAAESSPRSRVTASGLPDRHAAACTAGDPAASSGHAISIDKRRNLIQDCMTINDLGRGAGKSPADGICGGALRMRSPCSPTPGVWSSCSVVKSSCRLLRRLGARVRRHGRLRQGVSVAAISGYFAQGFGQSIVAGLDKAKKDFGVDVKLIDTGNRALDYEEQFNNVAKDGQYDLVFVMGWELVDALRRPPRPIPTSASSSSTACSTATRSSMPTSPRSRARSWPAHLPALMAEQGSAIEGLGDGKSIGFVGGRDIPVIRNFLRRLRPRAPRRPRPTSTSTRSSPAPSTIRPRAAS